MAVPLNSTLTASSVTCKIYSIESKRSKRTYSSYSVRRWVADFPFDSLCTRVNMKTWEIFRKTCKWKAESREKDFSFPRAGARWLHWGLVFGLTMSAAGKPGLAWWSSPESIGYISLWGRERRVSSRFGTCRYHESHFSAGNSSTLNCVRNSIGPSKNIFWPKSPAELDAGRFLCASPLEQFVADNPPERWPEKLS